MLVLENIREAKAGIARIRDLATAIDFKASKGQFVNAECYDVVALTQYVESLLEDTKAKILLIIEQEELKNV